VTKISSKHGKKPSVFSDSFVQKIFLSLSEEEEDLYVLNMHYKNSEDMNYFNEQDRGQIKKIFDVLIKDTQRHSDLLKLIYELMQK